MFRLFYDPREYLYLRTFSVCKTVTLLHPWCQGSSLVLHTLSEVSLLSVSQIQNYHNCHFGNLVYALIMTLLSGDQSL